MLADHSDIPILFKLAADWELDDCRNVEKARNHLKNGLQIHKKCAMLYLDLFRVQLIYINNKIIEEQEMMLRIPIVRLIRLEDMEYQQTVIAMRPMQKIYSPWMISTMQ
ncbi:U3 small nucleolar RNA-associated protein 6 homolog isoform X4 [Nilaparvata lugens]|uniref:U3 small nucleolar RNA-associated protein 6 homolog isoform X4 n=1 Tax=Nilaparvata lugens TaxID=108931 RepID=UPI00193CAB36|nr:U3 small nucleolar RNA-associated protein 6 homolog isoform X4 [Nilaparvata lugens]